MNQERTIKYQYLIGQQVPPPRIAAGDHKGPCSSPQLNACVSVRCKVVIKKRVLVKKRKTLKKKTTTVLGAQRRGNVTLVVAAGAVAAPQRKPPVDKKAVLKSKIQDILRGRSRFVIRKTPPTGSNEGSSGGGGGGAGGGGGGASTRGKEEVELSTPDGAAKAREESNFKRLFSSCKNKIVPNV